MRAGGTHGASYCINRYGGINNCVGELQEVGRESTLQRSPQKRSTDRSRAGQNALQARTLEYF
jgi:hypothetical protein